MTAITGRWQINANGSLGTLNFDSPDNIALHGSVTFPDTGGRTDTVTGIWSDPAGQLSMTRLLPGGGVQNYLGFLGNNHPENLIVAGSFTQSDVVGVPRTHFGWFITR